MKIKKITPKFPNLVNKKTFEKQIRKAYEKYEQIQELVYITREVLRTNEEILEKVKKEWEDLQAICDVEFEEEVVNEEVKGDADFNLAIINPSDRRNK